MSKIKKADLLQLVQEQADMVVELAGMVKMNKLSIIKLENEREQPKLKQLTQSVFDGLDEKWRFAAVDSNTSAYIYEARQHIEDNSYWLGDFGLQKYIGEGYDTSNWQNSLIEREKKELTGSELCKAMLARGDKYVMCLLSNNSEMNAKADNCTYVVRSFNESDCHFQAKYNRWQYAIPINNQGEPLTASEVGL